MVGMNKVPLKYVKAVRYGNSISQGRAWHRHEIDLWRRWYRDVLLWRRWK